MAFFLFALIVLAKAAIVRMMCAKSVEILTEKQECTAWIIALIVCILPALATAALAAILIPFGMAMATSPVSGDFNSTFGSTLLFLPLYFDWIVDFPITIICWSFYRGMMIGRSFLAAIMTYFAILIFEYAASIGALMMVKPPQ